MSITPQMLLAILGSPIAYHRIYATITGSVTSAVMLSQAMYWTPRSSDPHGWFYKTADEWQEETGLSRREQETARRILKDLQILEEKKQGLPCKLFFRVNLETLYSLIVESANQDPTKGKSKNGGKRQTGMYSFAIQDDTEAPNNLYTEITSENTTEIKLPCNFNLIPERKTDSLLDLSKPEDLKTPPLPPLSVAAQKLQEQFEGRFKNKPNRYAPQGLVEAGFGEWHLGEDYDNWRPSLIKVAQQVKRELKQPCEIKDATKYLFNIARQSRIESHWGTFKGMTKEAIAIEQSQQQRSQQQPTPIAVQDLIATAPPAHIRERFKTA